MGGTLITRADEEEMEEREGPMGTVRAMGLTENPGRSDGDVGRTG